MKMYENALLRYVGAESTSWRESLIRAEVTADRYAGTSATDDLRSGGEARSESRMVGRLARTEGAAEAASAGGGVRRSARRSYI